MKPTSEHQEQQAIKAAVKLKGADVFDNKSADLSSQPSIKSAVVVDDLDSVDLGNEPIDSTLSLSSTEVIAVKKAKHKWLVILLIAVIFASIAELAIFVVTTIKAMDWLAGVWLVILFGLGGIVVRLVIVEYKGLRQLKYQQAIRAQSEQMAATNVIGLAEQHCLKITKNLAQDYQHLAENWRNSIDPHHSDSEVLALFEHQVLAPIDQLAIKHVSQNASAASVMIAVSPFALLDMLIVLWRNIRMMNQVSEIYGLHLGYWGRITLIRKIFHTMLYAGAAEILSDAGNYALGAGITGKLSTRVAQGLGAGVLTARIGIKAINESRPLPWLSQAKPGLSGISKQLLADLNKHIS
ncbi:YcjF family protein [uncultured Paraglaciecola sp.]|uniref:YcjF family protein n=1 Tax=uncultured Paraglaciecola sp. TaxID=1765024 RepID=UPI00262EF7C6|nr:TIGR01620 family protein [uncultured Paraglaciecola sp.]